MVGDDMGVWGGVGWGGVGWGGRVVTFEPGDSLTVNRNDFKRPQVHNKHTLADAKGCQTPRTAVRHLSNPVKN